VTIWQHSLATLAVLLGTAAFVLGGCVDAADEESTGWIDRSGLGVLKSEPEVLVFEQADVGSEMTRRVELTNVGTGPVKITGFQLREEGGPEFDGRREFFEGADGWVDHAVSLAPGASYMLSVNYTRRNARPDQGVITMHTENTADDTFEVPIEASAAAPDLDAPEKVSFGRVAPRSDDVGAHRLITLRNAGSAVLRIDDVFVTGNDRFRVSFPQPNSLENPDDDSNTSPERLAPGQSVPVRVWFQPIDNLPERGELVVQSNDPDESVHGVELIGNASGACLNIDPRDELDFGQVAVGMLARRAVTLENCSAHEQLEISEVALAEDAGGVYSLADDQSLDGAVLDPGERRQLEVLVQATDAALFEGELVIASNDDANREMRLPIRASVHHCSVQANATAWVQGSTRPQTTVQARPLDTIMFDGSGSISAYGHIVDYEWTILSRPQDSTQRLLPDNSSVNPRLFLDSIGTYEIELVVRDDSGALSCGERAIITINVESNDDVYIHLVWDTPGDPDQTDTFGTDLDLHYMHPNGRWNEQPWDIFWRNSSANWGDPASSLDDPSLDINDTDGGGPETIRHSGLENLEYRVGAYYYSDHTLGASNATLRIYVHGALAFEIAQRHMPRSGAFWDAAAIDWPSGVVRTIDQMHQGFPQTP
jgi:hypothetical protein